MKRYGVVWFRTRDGKYGVPVWPLPRVWFVSDCYIADRTFNIEPLTLRNLARAIVANFGRNFSFTVCRGLFSVGLLDTPAGNIMSIRKDWRWRFWRTLANRHV